MSSANILDRSGPGSIGNERVLQIPQSSSITGPSPSEYLVLYQDIFCGVSYTSAEKQLMYSMTPVDWDQGYCSHFLLIEI